MAPPIFLIVNVKEWMIAGSPERIRLEWATLPTQIGVYAMANFNPAMILPTARSAEFADAGEQKRSAKTILIEGIVKQIDFYANPTKEGRRWFVRGQKEVCLTLRIGNKPLKLNGEETKVVVPAEHFDAAMNHYKSEIEKGKFDAQLAEADKGMEERRDKLRATRSAKKTA